MYRNFLTMAALAAAAGWSAQVSAQSPTALPAPVAAPYTVPTQSIVTTPSAGRPVGPVVAPGTQTFTVQYVPAVPASVASGVPGAPTMVIHPRAIPPTAGNITAISPQPTYAMMTTHVPVAPAPYPVTNIVSQPAPMIPQNTQVYTPSYYYYYYQKSYQAPAAPVVPVVPIQPVAINAFSGAYIGASGPMCTARGEMGHVSYPYYSYRRPWYWAGQPGFNATIRGPVW